MSGNVPRQPRRDFRNVTFAPFVVIDPEERARERARRPSPLRVQFAEFDLPDTPANNLIKRPITRRWRPSFVDNSNEGDNTDPQEDTDDNLEAHAVLSEMVSSDKKASRPAAPQEGSGSETLLGNQLVGLSNHSRTSTMAKPNSIREDSLAQPSCSPAALHTSRSSLSLSRNRTQNLTESVSPMTPTPNRGMGSHTSPLSWGSPNASSGNSGRVTASTRNGKHHVEVDLLSDDEDDEASPSLRPKCASSSAGQLSNDSRRVAPPPSIDRTPGNRAASGLTSSPAWTSKSTSAYRSAQPAGVARRLFTTAPRASFPYTQTHKQGDQSQAQPAPIQGGPIGGEAQGNRNRTKSVQKGTGAAINSPANFEQQRQELGITAHSHQPIQKRTHTTTGALGREEHDGENSPSRRQGELRPYDKSHKKPKTQMPPNDPSIPMGSDFLTRMPIEVRQRIYGKLLKASHPINVLNGWSQVVRRQQLQVSILGVSKKHNADASAVLYGENVFRYVLRDDAKMVEFEVGKKKDKRTLPFKKQIDNFRYLKLEVEPDRIDLAASLSFYAALEILVKNKASKLMRLTIDLSPRLQKCIQGKKGTKDTKDWISQRVWFTRGQGTTDLLKQLKPHFVSFDVHLEENNNSRATSLRTVIDLRPEIDGSKVLAEFNTHTENIKRAMSIEARWALAGERVDERLEAEAYKKLDMMSTRLEQAVLKGAPHMLHRGWFMELKPSREQRKVIQAGHPAQDYM